jgi:acetolactate synthase-1/2/3 large subunit
VAAVRSGGRILVDQLRVHGVDTVFCVPGESYLAALDALRDSGIRLVVCRQEGGAANMADAYGKLTGRPGVLFVTRGPGAANASLGVHTSFQDSTPVVVLIGQVARSHGDREAFQEIDYRRFYSEITKWAAQVDQAARIPELVARAFATACAGRPGPVALAFPEDVLADEETDAPDAEPYRPVAASPAAADMARLRELLAAARRPFVVVGGGGWSVDASRGMQAFVEANRLPVGASFRCQDYVDNRSPSYAGDIGLGINPKLARRIGESDFLLVVGARLGEATSQGYTLVGIPRPLQALVHVHAGAEELGRVYQADVPINSGYAQFAAAAAALDPVDSSGWADWTAAAHADWEENLRHRPMPGDVDLGDVMAFLRERLPEDAILTNGAGNFSVWAHRFYRFTRYRTQLGPTSGAMGYGLPAAVAAKLVHPERIVVCFTGDGDFLMTGQELATAVQYALPVVVLLVNNGMYGTIRMHQERRYPGRVVGTDLVNPDFAALAAAFGAHGEAVERTADFSAAFERALGSGGPALVELRVDPEAITPRATLSELRAAAERVGPR